MRKNKWSLIELTIILVVLSILCAILAPVIDRYVRNAKVIRCREDIQAIGMAIVMCIEDTANSYFLVDAGSGSGNAAKAGRPNQYNDFRVDLLVGDGDVPELNGVAGSQYWCEADSTANVKVDELEDHIVTNVVGYRTPTDLTNATATDLMFARSESGGFNSEFAWRGPYMTAPIDPDPWGNRYAVNVQFLDACADSTGAMAAVESDTTPFGAPVGANAGAGYESDTVVLSAGPDEEVDTLWAVDGLTPGDDDLIYTISGNSRP